MSMYKLFGKDLRRFHRDERGNVFILFGAAVVPLFLILGGTVDVARYARYKIELANAVDAAALALARQGSDYTEEQAKTFITNYVTSFMSGDSQFTVQSFDVDKLANGFQVSASGSMKTMFLPLGHLAKNGSSINSMGVNILAEVVNSSNRLEVALVFDNTGSMNCGNTQTGSCVTNWSNPGTSSRIHNLKVAAQSLVDVLMPDGGEYSYIKIALVPFEGAVNIGSTYANNPPSWVDWSNDAKAKYNGQNFGKYNFTTSATCTTGTNCKFVGHKWLYDKLHTNDANVKWEGCVEMRAEPYDLLDTVPTTATPDTLFVPYFWPDEPDSDNNDGDDYNNNYLNDRTTSNGSAAQKNVGKFTNIGWQSGKKDTAFPFESGPNFGCPKPIVPLTNVKSTIETAIDGMVAYYSTGTFIPTGLAWGWHVLSPTEPFTQGIAPGDEHYEQTLKAVVLFTDGENFITGTDNHNDSRYSGYNYTNMQVGGTYRLGDDDASNAVNELDDKTAELCENVKDGSIRLYTITFGNMSEADQDLMEECASEDSDGSPLYFHAPSTSDLQDIFNQIGEDLSEIHLSM